MCPRQGTIADAAQWSGDRCAALDAWSLLRLTRGALEGHPHRGRAVEEPPSRNRSGALGSRRGSGRGLVPLFLIDRTAIKTQPLKAQSLKVQALDLSPLTGGITSGFSGGFRLGSLKLSGFFTTLLNTGTGLGHTGFLGDGWCPDSGCRADAEAPNSGGTTSLRWSELTHMRSAPIAKSASEEIISQPVRAGHAQMHSFHPTRRNDGSR